MIQIVGAIVVYGFAVYGLVAYLRRRRRSERRD